MYFSQTNRFLIFIAICFLIFLIGIFKLPVLDRDEARFATASKTMIYEKEYIDIKMYDEPRYKKPVGIYWLQVASNYLFGFYPYDEISIYRLPSICSIFISFIIIFFSLRKIFGGEVSFLSVFLLMFCLLSISEMLQAKTDGVLFLTIVICNTLILYLLKKKKTTQKIKHIFWGTLAFGVLIKGPIIFVFTILPLIIFSALKKYNFFKNIFSLSAFLLFFIISVPWFVLITIKSGGSFWLESVGHDLFGKVSSGQESHGFPPGYYLITTLFLFWPGSIFIYPFLKTKCKNFFEILRTDNVTFYLLISFLIPYLIYEIIPTKLPHYIYPAYFPLSILISKSIIDGDLEKVSKKYLYFLTSIFPVISICAIIYLTLEYSEINEYFYAVLIILILQVLYLVKNINVKKIGNTLLRISIFQISFYLILVFYVNKNLEVFWIAKNINVVIEKSKNKYDEIYNYGFNEPSLVFLTSHKSKKINPDNLKVNDLKNKKIMFFINDEFVNTIQSNKNFKNFKMIDEFVGFNYSKGKEIKLKIFSNLDHGEQ